MCVCDNVGDHLVGNVYCQYRYEENAGEAVDELNKRFYAGRPLYAELSPVTDFREACCRQYEMGECTRGGFCNFMHLKLAGRSLKRELFEAQRATLRERRHAEGGGLGSGRGERSRSRESRESGGGVKRGSRSREREREERKGSRHAQEMEYEEYQ